MAHSSEIYVDATLSLTGGGVAAAGFGGLMGAFTHSVTANRLDGPYASLTEVEAAGFTAAASAPIHAWATDVFSQQPNAPAVYIGRIDSGDADLGASLSAIDAANPGKWVHFTIEDRTATQIKAAFAWAEPRVKLFYGQSNDTSLLSGTGAVHTITFSGTETDGDYETTFTGFGLGAPVTVTTTRSTTPATNANLATQHAADITTLIATTLDGVVSTAVASTDTVVVTLANDLASGAITHDAPAPGTLTSAVTDDDLASDLEELAYTHGGLWYNASDSDYLDAAVASRFAAFDVDVRKGTASFLKLTGMSLAAATTAQINALRDTNTNYYDAVVSAAGATTVGFTAPGKAPSGQYLDITLSLFVVEARLEEALIQALLNAPEGIPYDDNGIGQIEATVRRVLDSLITSRHIDPRVVPDDETYAGEQTPLVIMPTQASLTSAQISSRELTFSSVFYFQQFVEKVTMNVTARL